MPTPHVCRLFALRRRPRQRGPSARRRRGALRLPRPTAVRSGWWRARCVAGSLPSVSIHQCQQHVAGNLCIAAAPAWGAVAVAATFLHMRHRWLPARFVAGAFSLLSTVPPRCLLPRRQYAHCGIMQCQDKWRYIHTAVQLPAGVPVRRQGPGGRALREGRGGRGGT